jgi:hydroxymethylpyrimidine/phosphomethylpyrimidine kinase
MVAKGGDRLLQVEAVQALREVLIPLATIVTPNVPEAETLLNRKIETLRDARDAARALVELGAGAAVVKGGHLQGQATDVLFDGKQYHEFTAERIDTPNTHGTGCTFASAIAAGLAKGNPLEKAVADAKRYVTCAISNGIQIGNGHGPLNHFFAFWGRDSG